MFKVYSYYKKCKKVLDSCQDYHHYNVCSNMIHNYGKMSDFIGALCLFCVLVFTIGNFLFSLNCIITNRNIKYRAIESKIAQYNPISGDFEWIDEKFKFVMIGKTE